MEPVEMKLERQTKQDHLCELYPVGAGRLLGGSKYKSTYGRHLANTLKKQRWFE